MKIVAFKAQDGRHLGVVEGDHLIDLQAADPKAPRELAKWLRQNKGELSPLADLAKRAPASARLPLSGITYATPVGNPGKIVCLGLNYLEHVKEGFQKDNIPKFPTIFMRCTTSLVGHEQPILRPAMTDSLDYEAELVVIIGKRVKHLTMANALSCIAGYSCFNDGSVREFQRRTS